MQISAHRTFADALGKCALPVCVLLRGETNSPAGARQIWFGSSEDAIAQDMNQEVTRAAETGIAAADDPLIYRDARTSRELSKASGSR